MLSLSISVNDLRSSEGYGKEILQKPDYSTQRLPNSSCSICWYYMLHIEVNYGAQIRKKYT